MEQNNLIHKRIYNDFIKKYPHLKEGSEELEWGKMEFSTDNMTDKEFEKFCIYRYGTKMPFKIEVLDLV